MATTIDTSQEQQRSISLMFFAKVRVTPLFINIVPILISDYQPSRKCSINIIIEHEAALGAER